MPNEPISDETLIEVASDSKNAASEALAALRETALSNPLLADQLGNFDQMRPIWQRYRTRFDSLRALANGQPSI